MSEPLRIGMIMGKWVGGGVEAVIMNYYRHIDRSKIQFDFICDSDSTNIPYDEIQKLGGIVIIIPPYQRVFKYHKELKSVLKKNNYKIVHSHINTLSIFSLFAAKRAGVPIRIAHSHATTNKKEIKRNLVKCFLKPFNKIFATHYMCCSEHAGRWMFGNKAYDNKKVVLVNNAINIDDFIFNKINREECRKKIGIKSNQIVIGHVGRMVETKNHSFLISVFAKLCQQKDAVLILIGQGPLEEKIKKQVSEMGIRDRVEFLGQIEDVNKWYQAFDVFVLPSLYEGFGMALLEAQASNLPCIASTGVPEEAKLIDDFEFLSLDCDVDVWVNSILKVTQKNKRKSNKRILSEKGYDISTEANKLLNYYTTSLEGDNSAKD